MKTTFNPTKEGALNNATKNLARLRASLVVQQQQELAKQRNILAQVEKDYDNAQKELFALDDDSTAYVEKQKQVDEIALVMSITKETIAQYQMNLSEYDIEA